MENMEEMDGNVDLFGDDGITDVSLDWGEFDLDGVEVSESAETLADGLISCLNTLGRVDVPYIAVACGKTCEEVVEGLKGAIFQNPETWDKDRRKGWETADAYLSGNLLRKWRIANDANEKYVGLFEENVRAIEKILPKSVACEDIYVTLGSPWLPTTVVDDFIEHLLGPYVSTINEKFRSGYLVCHDETTGVWEVPGKSRYRYGQYAVRANSAFGTKRMEALEIIERTLNMKTIVVKDEIPVAGDPKKTKRVVNRDETLLAIEKQDIIVKEFKDWVWKDDQRKKLLTDIFDERFGSIRHRRFDGSFLTFPLMDKQAKLYAYQKNAVARILFSPNVLLAHEVGCGKTYIMVAAGMELRRIGISKKNMYVVPNSLLGQWRDIFAELYPHARVLSVEPKDFTPKKRLDTLRNMRDGDYDGILIAYSCFDRIAVSKKIRITYLENKLADIERIIQEKQDGYTFSLTYKKKQIADELKKLRADVPDDPKEIFFEHLEVNTLFVDEAHNYKNIGVDSQIEYVLGIAKTASEKCQGMLRKARIVQKQNGGRGVVFATGTPITNSITDAFVMQKYLQNGELTLLDLQNFDAWVGMFAEKTTEFEIDVDTNSYRMATRFSKFHNLTELTALLSSIADFYRADGQTGVPATDGAIDCLVGKTPMLQNYLDDISRRADLVRSGMVNRLEDNMLKITTDGRKAALDLRLVDKTAAFHPQCKVARCAENVFDIYLKTLGKRSTQLIFCDTSTPKQGFNVYDELTRLLVDAGMPADKIAYIHDATSDRAREDLFNRMRTGDLRVLIGSTFKLGLGVNIQDKMIAVHHLDIPWRPADMVQREGRILRQGNENKKVYIYRYVTDGSFDAYSWQLLESKQRFIAQLLSGTLSEKESEDVDGVVLDYAEVKALAIGNPLIKERVETANELTKLLTLQRKTQYNRQLLEGELFELPARLDEQRKRFSECMLDRDEYQQAKREYAFDEKRELRAKIFAAVQGYDANTAKETQIAEYQGFQVLLPAYMVKEKPFVWLKRNGKYYVELGDVESTVLTRIDNRLNTLDELLAKFRENVRSLIVEKAEIEKELEKTTSYADEIETCRQKLAEIDKKLGVKKK